jgi:hypothetical protein
MAENRTHQAAAEALGCARSQERTGMCTTALGVTVGERIICVDYAGRAHAGENLQAWLAQREADRDKPRVMSDARSRHAVEETTVMRCHCLAPGRRQCSDLADVLPMECQGVMDLRKQVFDHEAEARAQQRSPEARFAYHQEESQPRMDERRQWRQKQVDDPRVEPKSALGNALASRQTHWETLTRLFSIPGAPLENHLVERALQRFLRQRKNALLYRTEHSASLASGLTSVLAPCSHAGGKALESLGALQAHRAEVFAHPEAGLPWSSQAQRGPPEAPRRQSWAMGAPSGAPFHRNMMSSRAPRGTRASTVVGHQVQRPCATLFRQSQSPWPS